MYMSPTYGKVGEGIHTPIPCDLRPWNEAHDAVLKYCLTLESEVELRISKNVIIICIYVFKMCHFIDLFWLETCYVLTSVYIKNLSGGHIHQLNTMGLHCATINDLHRFIQILARLEHLLRL